MLVPSSINQVKQGLFLVKDRLQQPFFIVKYTRLLNLTGQLKGYLPLIVGLQGLVCNGVIVEPFSYSKNWRQQAYY